MNIKKIAARLARRKSSAPPILSPFRPLCKLVMQLNRNSYETAHAQCSCPAGCGPKASCKHIAALCYALEETKAAS